MAETFTYAFCYVPSCLSDRYVRHDGKLSKVCKEHFLEYIECYFDDEDSFYEIIRAKKSTESEWDSYVGIKGIKEVKVP